MILTDVLALMDREQKKKQLKKAAPMVAVGLCAAALMAAAGIAAGVLIAPFSGRETLLKIKEHCPCCTGHPRDGGEDAKDNKEE